VLLAVWLSGRGSKDDLCTRAAQTASLGRGDPGDSVPEISAAAAVGAAAGGLVAVPLFVAVGTAVVLTGCGVYTPACDTGPQDATSRGSAAAIKQGNVRHLDCLNMVDLFGGREQL
jgi:hypothetical protein